jgi:uncharacterized membrane protein YphA (DoxX/SURF4 family)
VAGIPKLENISANQGFFGGLGLSPELVLPIALLEVVGGIFLIAGSTVKKNKENTAIIMIDYSVGFTNIFRSHTIDENIRATTALAKTALGFHTDLVVNHGKGQQIFPELAKVLGDHQIIYRGGEYNALDNLDVSEAVEKTGCSRVAIAGLMTEGCTSTNVI